MVKTNKQTPLRIRDTESQTDFFITPSLSKQQHLPYCMVMFTEIESEMHYGKVRNNDGKKITTFPIRL